MIFQVQYYSKGNPNYRSSISFCSKDITLIQAKYKALELIEEKEGLSKYTIEITNVERIDK